MRTSEMLYRLARVLAHVEYNEYLEACRRVDEDPNAIKPLLEASYAPLEPEAGPADAPPQAPSALVGVSREAKPEEGTSGAGRRKSAEPDTEAWPAPRGTSAAQLHAMHLEAENGSAPA